MTRFQTEHLAALAVATSGLFWGLFWIPLRGLDAQGIAGVWAVAMFYIVPALLLVPVFLWRARRLLRGGWQLHIAGLFAGLALVLYSGALVFTDVVRALLFYYLTPLWSTLLARVFLRETITGLRWLTIGLALIGLMVLLNVDTGIRGGLGVGDWMGIASGIIWAGAAVLMKSHHEGDSVDFTLSYFLWGSIAAVALTLLPIDGGMAMPDRAAVIAVLPWMVPVAAILVVPPAFAIMWGATILSPGLLGILFMTEISIGTLTAAIWANEPFGLREAAGVLLITTAGILEPVRDLLSARRPPVAGNSA